MSQVEMIRRHLEKYGTISQAEARQIYNVNRLASRIHDLRGRGYEIESVLKKDPTGRSYSRYFMAHRAAA